jgi:hypothetical protein
MVRLDTVSLVETSRKSFVQPVSETHICWPPTVCLLVPENKYCKVEILVNALHKGQIIEFKGSGNFV